MRKFTLEYVKSEIVKFDYKCLSDIYVNNKTKLELECDKGHKYEATWVIFSRGQRCPICAGVKKKTIEEIKLYIESFNYKCLSDIYVNNKTKLELECDKGHKYEATWANFLKKARCPHCNNNDSKKTIEEVKLYIESFDYKCLSEEYKGALYKLKLECNKGHKYKVVWHYFKSGNRCPICWMESISGKNHYKWKNYTDEDRKNIELYRNEIMKLSNINYGKYYYYINPNNLERGRNKFHLDHIYSVIDGFNNNVDPDIMANPMNLQMLSESTNTTKNGKSYMTLARLYQIAV